MSGLINVSSLKNGEIAVISKIEGLDVYLHKRFIELGFVSGEKVEVVKKNRLALIVGIRGYCLCIDNFIAECIFVWGER